MLALRLPEDIEKRLEALARKTGRTKSYYAREAILRHLEDLEDAHLARERLKRRRGRVTLETRSEEHTSELQSRQYLVCRLLLENKNKNHNRSYNNTSLL